MDEQERFLVQKTEMLKNIYVHLMSTLYITIPDI